MCGIAGLYHFDGAPASADAVVRMGEAIRHRGPDGDGIFVDGPVAFAHRRLAILDLSPQAAQPFHSENGRFVTVYNGELYNHLDLRKELADSWHFRTRSDTETILAAYATWGPKCVERFNGMFAFAVWDREEQTLFLARDRYGVKPLYWTQRGSTLLFGSEIKALIASGLSPVELDRPGLLEYFTFQNFFGSDTLFRGVHMFPPGHRCLLKLGENDTVEPELYWDFDFREDSSLASVSEKELEEELDRLLRAAVQRQLMSDVDVGAYLSGGLDSSALVALAVPHRPDLKTFTVGFDMNATSGLELALDERSKAEAVATLFRTEHYEMVLKPGDMQRALPVMARHLEEPRVGQSYPNFYAAKLASGFVKVVLSGAGGDELFAGYPWRYYRAAVNVSFDDYVDKYYQFWHRLIPNSAIREVFAPIWGDVDHVWSRDIFCNVFRERPSRVETPEEYVNRSLYFEAKTFLHGLLVVEDKLSMAHGIESRVPFLDNDLVDFAMRVPVRFKLGNLSEVVRLNENEPGQKTQKYFEKTRDGKLLLRKVVERYAPAQVSQGIKQGFSGPDSSWFRGESVEFVRAVVFDDGARMFQYLDRKAVRRLVTDHLEGQVNRRLLIWSLLNFEQWLHQFA